MVNTRFFVLDATYKVVDDRARIYLYGRTQEGKQVVVIDPDFLPYFYVIPKDGDNLKKRLEGFRMGDEMHDHRVLKVEDARMVYDGEQVLALKVFTNLPGAVPKISDEMKNWKEVRSVHENDILFVRRYLIDKGIYPFSLVEAEGEWSLERSRAASLLAKEVRLGSTERYDAPKVLAVDIETYQQEGRGVDFEKNPILMIAVFADGVEKVITWKRFEGAGPFVEFVDSEAQMIQRWKEIVVAHGPDIIVGYYSDGFDLPYIKARADKYGIKMDLGMDYSEMRTGKTKKEAEIPGLVHIDVLSFIRRVIGRTMETDVFTLDAVATELLGEGKKSVDLDKLSTHWDTASKELAEFAEYNLHDARITHKLALLILPNILELVSLCGLLPFDASRNSISQLIEGYIFRQAKERNILSFNKPGYQESSNRMKQSAKGAFVFEPTPGLYEKIVVFDFRSLYPSIIVSHNISPETFRCSCCEGQKPVPLEGVNYWFCEKKRGFVPTILEDLIVRRNRIKEMLKESKKKDPLLIARSDALKWLANSFYGYLGFAQSRWYSFECVESITGFGRKYITTVIESAQKKGFVVLYSDTDSIFLKLGDLTKDDAKRFVEEINFSFPGMLELDFENYYPAGLFVGVKGKEESEDVDEEEKGAKKKYALVDEKGTLKVKGFETVRRNTSIIAKEVQRTVLEYLLRDRDSKKAVDFVKTTIEDLKKGRIPTEKVVILTMLTKDTSSYETVGPHVAAAERMKGKGYVVGAGSMIKYVIAKGGPKDKIRDRVRLPEEITTDDYDPNYYIDNQIIPAVERILSVFGYTKEDLLGVASQKTLGKFF